MHILLLQAPHFFREFSKGEVTDVSGHSRLLQQIFGTPQGGNRIEMLLSDLKLDTIGV